MEKLQRADLHSLEEYDKMRKDFRALIMEHKKDRRLAIGPNANVYFEDRLTMHYQVQEMLRIEKIFQSEAIEEELAAYNPLIPDGSNWKATFMLEFDDESERRIQLAKMIGIEAALWFQVEGHEKVTPIANEDLERTNDVKTSSVHFIRIELTKDMINSLNDGAAINAGIDHDAYRYELNPVPENIRASLLQDLN